MVSGEVLMTVGIVLVGAALALVESARDGRLSDWYGDLRSSQEVGDEAHEMVVEKLDKIDKLDDIESTVQRVDDKVDKIDDIGEAMVLIHQDDEYVDEEALREKVGVEDLSSDIVEGD
jgi:hypothetical protein